MMIKERGKAVEMYRNDGGGDHGEEYYSSDLLPCKKHPSSSSVGICAYCLKERLVKLVCSDCGEQRLSSCSCSDEMSSSNRNSCTVEVGSVGRISFLIENEGNNIINNNNSSSSQSQSHSNSNNKPKDHKADDVFLLKRSSSSCVEIKRKSGFWRIGKLFSKRREKGNSNNNNNNNCERNSVGGFEEKSDLWVVDYMGVSRSRSLCSFRGGGFFGSEDGTFSGARSSISGARSSISAARSSISAARNSGVNGLLFDPDRKSGFSEAEPRKSGFDHSEKKDAVLDPEKPDSYFNGGANNTRRVFSLKEGNFTTTDDSGFIDLKFDFPSSDLPYTVKMGGGGGGALSDSNSAFGSMRRGDFLAQDQYGDGLFSNGGSCRITVTDRGIKRSRKSFKSWRWIFRHNPNAKKKEDDQEDIVVSNHA